MRTALGPQTVAALRAQGFDVRVRHIRRWRANPVLATLFEATTAERFLTPWQLDPCGGKTVVTISKDERVLATGATTVSDKDTYNKRLGLIKALGRALGELERNLPTFRLATTPPTEGGT